MGVSSFGAAGISAGFFVSVGLGVSLTVAGAALGSAGFTGSGAVWAVTAAGTASASFTNFPFKMKTPATVAIASTVNTTRAIMATFFFISVIQFTSSI